MRLTLTSIAAILSFCAISNLALGQSVEPQLEAPEPDITTFDAGESYTTTFDTKNDIDIRILDDGTLINGAGYNLYNNEGGTLNNYGTLNNNNGRLLNYGTLDNYGFLDNFGTLTNNVGGTLNNFGTLNNICVLSSACCIWSY